MLYIISYGIYFIAVKFYLLITITYFTQSPTLPHLWKPPTCSLYLWICFYFVCSFVFQIPHINAVILDLSLSDFISLSIIPSQFSSVQLLSCVRLLETPWTGAHQASLSITNSWSLLKLMSIESVMPSNHLIFCHPLLLLPSIFPSIRVFSNEWALGIRWPKYWSFSFSISPSNEYSGLISLRMDWLDLLAVQGTLKSLLQYHSSKASILWLSAFFTVQLSHPYMTIVINSRWFSFIWLSNIPLHICILHLIYQFIILDGHLVAFIFWLL